MKYFITLISLVLFHVSKVQSCSCEFVYFCDYISDIQSGQVFYGEVIEKKVYSADNHAMYLKVLHKISGENITDTVKIYGAEFSVSCEESIGAYDIGDQFVFAFNDFLMNYNDDIVNPEAATENYTEYKPFTCLRSRLFVENGVVRGGIQEELYEYPLDLFISEVNGCQFTAINMVNLTEKNRDFSIAPNPASEVITIKTNLEQVVSVDLNFYNNTGKLMLTKKQYTLNHESIKLDFLTNGLYIIEINWEGKKTYRKFIVQGR